MTDMTETALSALSQSISAVVERAAGHVVSVMSHHSLASGFVWRPGLIVTAEEALAEEGEVFVQPHGGERIRATRLGRDHSTDIALLRVDRSDWPALPLGRRLSAGGQPSRSWSAPPRAAPPQPWAWCRAPPVRGAACAAAISMRGSELDVALRRGAPGRGRARCPGQRLRHGRARSAPDHRDPGQDHRARRRFARKARPDAARLFRPRPSGGSHLRQQARRDGDERRCRRPRRRKPEYVQGDVITAINGAAVEGVQEPAARAGSRTASERSVDLLVARGGTTSTIAVSIGERPHGMTDDGRRLISSFRWR